MLWTDQREFLADNLLVRIHFIIVMISRTGLTPWEFEFPFSSSLLSTLLGTNQGQVPWAAHQSTDQQNSGVAERLLSLAAWNGASISPSVSDPAN